MFFLVSVLPSLFLASLVRSAPSYLEGQFVADQGNALQVKFSATASPQLGPPVVSSPIIVRPATALSQDQASPNSSCSQRRKSPLVMAYYPDWAGPSHPPESISFSRFDCIDFAFALPTENFDLSWDSPEGPDLLRRLISSAHGNSRKPRGADSGTGTKIKLSVGGWTGSKYFSQAVSTEQNRITFANNIRKVYDEFDLDGIDLDWEYPGREGAGGNQVDSKDSANFLSFLRLLRSVLPQGAYITAAAQTVPFADASGEPLKDVSQFASVLDWLLLMNYDVWSPSPNPGPNAPLYDACENSSQPEGNAVAAYNKWTSAGFPACQLVLGVPSYGYLSKSRATSLRQRRSSPARLDQFVQARDPASPPSGPTVYVVGENGSPEGQITFKELVKQGALVLSQPADAHHPAVFEGGGGFVRYWDNCSCTPFLRSESAGQVISYDDTESLSMKAKFAAGTGMLGVNMFDTSGDTPNWDLTLALHMASD